MPQILITLKRLTRRGCRLTGQSLLFGFVFFGLGNASAPSKYDLAVQMAEATAADRFDFVDWESWAVLSELNRRRQPPNLPPSPAAQSALVQTYVDNETRRDEYRHNLDQFYAVCPNGPVDSCPAPEQQKAARLQRDLAAIDAAQAPITAQVETILSRQIEAVLRDEGFDLAGQILPPVAFRLIDPPTALIISPRDKIEKTQFTALAPGLDNARRARIEAALDRRGDVSSYVTDVGGLGSYPTMVIRYSRLPWLVETIAHEWAHNYFYTFPSNLAWGYQTYPKLTTINETTADIMGEEIGRKVIAHFYPDWVKELPPLDDAGQPAPAAPSEFDLTMRRIRRHVDELLAAGHIDQAEAYMEAERLKLVEQGHNLRKLNQAYFAFHGSYALSPTSVDPIGPQLRQLRAASPTLKAFVNRAGWLYSYDDFLAWLEEAGLKSSVKS